MEILTSMKFQLPVNGLTHVKCIYYKRFQVKGHLGNDEGSQNLQKTALIDHNKFIHHVIQGHDDLQ